MCLDATRDAMLPVLCILAFPDPTQLVDALIHDSSILHFFMLLSASSRRQISISNLVPDVQPSLVHHKVSDPIRAIIYS